MAGGSGRERVLGDDEIDEQGAFVDINVTPLVDIFLVLLVILMATSTAILEAGQGAGSGYRVQLPSGASAEEVGDLGEEFVVAIPAEGAMIFRGEEVSLGELADAFVAEAAKNPDRLVLVQADEKAFHQRVVKVMEAARKSGLKNLAIATQPE